MKKKTEALSCIDSTGTESTRIVQTERHALTNEQFTIILNRVVAVIAILAFTAIAIFGSAIKLGIAVFTVFIIGMMSTIKD